MVNMVFGCHDSQNMCQKGLLIIILCTLNDKHVNTSAFALCHLVEVVKTTHNNVIDGGNCHSYSKGYKLRKKLWRFGGLTFVRKFSYNYLGIHE